MGHWIVGSLGSHVVAIIMVMSGSGGGEIMYISNS